MTLVDVSLGFTLGLIGSLHCVQMCGPVVLAYSLPLPTEAARRQIQAHLSYNAGRIATYTLLGALAGSLGGALGVLGRLAGIFNAAALVAGVLMIAFGVWMTGLFGGAGLISFTVLGPGSPWLRRVGALLRSPSPGSKLALGLLLGFMPCGLIYAALFKAIDTASPLRGAVTMLAFGIGTAGTLLVTGLFSGTLARWLGRWTRRLPAYAVILMGLFLLWRGIAGMSVDKARTHHGHADRGAVTSPATHGMVH